MVTPTYLPRSWWADSDWPRGGAQLVDDDLHRLGNVCHYPGRASAFGIMTLSNLRSNLRGWRNFHVNTRGWSDIGYQMCVSMTTEGPVVVDLRGIGRVPAAHASASNPRANWHGGATLWTIGNTESIHLDLIDAYRHFRRTVWLPRWPTATGVTHHRRVPGAKTSCAGDNMDKLVLSGTLKQPPSEDSGEDDMFTDADRALLQRLNQVIASNSDEKVDRPDTATGTAGMRFALEQAWTDTHSLTEPVPWQSSGVQEYVKNVLGWVDAVTGEAREVRTRYLIEIIFSIVHRSEIILAQIFSRDPADVDEAALAQALVALLPQLDTQRILDALNQLPEAVRLELKAAL